MKKILLIAACAALSGCALDQQLDQWTLDGYEKKCDAYGFHRGTEAYSTCLLKQQELDDSDLQHSLDRSAHSEHKK
ncbi:hypothetical protein [Enterobacter asburiae]|uniref:hypothetical protein n=1 Tax=Enterobacter asburiae TaxID=61645 RepID=UPI001E64EF71|nr:hypothetical protein [Enterobacter asburiae]MCE2004220.1 hypothetical protein [Enterobacter asburiae]